MRLTRLVGTQVARLSWLLAGIAGVWLALAAFCVFGCLALMLCACVEGAEWLFMAPARGLEFRMRLRLPRGWK